MKNLFIFLIVLLSFTAFGQWNPSTTNIRWNPISGPGLPNGTFNCGQAISNIVRISIIGGENVGPTSNYLCAGAPLIINVSLTGGATFIGTNSAIVTTTTPAGNSTPPNWSTFFAWSSTSTILTGTQIQAIPTSTSGTANNFAFNVRVPTQLTPFGISVSLSTGAGTDAELDCGLNPDDLNTSTGDDLQSTVGDLWCRSLPFESVAIQSLHLEAQGIGLTWKTFNESNTKIFEIERMIDVKNNTWLNIGTVPAAGTSIQELTYQYMDKTSTAAAKIYYRIKQIDQDGSFIYSDSRSIQPLRSKLALSIEGYPNPTRGTYNLSIESKTDETMQLEIFDILGKSILKQNIPVQAGSNLHPIAMDRLNTGTYLVKVSGKETSEVLTVMKVD